jgi:hypothetical protein
MVIQVNRNRFAEYLGGRNYYDNYIFDPYLESILLAVFPVSENSIR